MNEEITTFELQTVTYGTACASFLAVRTMHELTNIEAANYPMGYSTIVNDFYMDDLVTGANTKSEIIEIRDQTSSS